MAREAVDRVRINLTRLRERLLELGFAFAAPEEAFVEAKPGARGRLDELEAELGPLSLTGRARFEAFHSVSFEQAEAQLVGERASDGLQGLGSHPVLVVRPFDEGRRALLRYREQILNGVVGGPDPLDGTYPPMLFVGPVLSNCETAHFEMGAHSFDDLRFAADGRDDASFFGLLRDACRHGGFPFWHHHRATGVSVPWIPEPDLDRLLPLLTRDLLEF